MKETEEKNMYKKVDLRDAWEKKNKKSLCIRDLKMYDKGGLSFSLAYSYSNNKYNIKERSSRMQSYTRVFITQ